MPYNVEILTNEQLNIALVCYANNIPELESKLFETSNADEIEQITKQLVRLQEKQAAVENEKLARGI